MKPLARLTLLLTVLLITLGGFVHNTGSSLACPDWPLCFGQVFPKMEGGVAIEHSHRLLAASVGLFTLILAFLAGRSALPKRLKKLSWIALLLVIFQGVLGGLTVIFQISPLLSTLHLATSQIFLAVLIDLNWNLSPRPESAGPQAARSALRWALIFTYLQMILGAIVRHGAAGSICGLGAEALVFCNDPITATPTLWPTLLAAKANMLHRILGILTGAAVIGGTLPTLKWAKSQGLPLIRKLCVGTHILWTFQLILGLLMLRYYLAVTPTTLHLLLATLLWGTLVSLEVLTRAERKA